MKVAKNETLEELGGKNLRESFVNFFDYFHRERILFYPPQKK